MTVMLKLKIWETRDNNRIKIFKVDPFKLITSCYLIGLTHAINLKKLALLLRMEYNIIFGLLSKDMLHGRSLQFNLKVA